MPGFGGFAIAVFCGGLALTAGIGATMMMIEAVKCAMHGQWVMP